MHDSDYFAGYCPCNDYPCKRSVAAQARRKAIDELRTKVYHAYVKHHSNYPQSAFIDDVFAVINEEKMRATPSKQHLIKQETVNDIDGSVVWHYASCACGWESKCVRAFEPARDAATEHFVKYVEGK